MIYRGIVYTIEENRVKLFNKAGVHKFKDSGGKLSTFTNGEAFVSFPEDLEMTKEDYTKKVINSLYSRMEYHKKQELRGKIY